MTDAANRTHTKPDFLGIGAQKAGTTWLNECLAASDRVWVPPVKELAFFSSLPDVPRPGERATFSSGYLDTFDRVAADLDDTEEITSWVRSYRRPSMTLGEYVDHFPSSTVSGEITPEYQELTSERVGWMARRLPRLKPIFMMRDPIERCWSDLRMSVRYGFAEFEEGVDPTEDEMIAYLDLPIVSTRTDYGQTIDRWSEAFGHDALFCAFNDELEDDPLDLLSRVCTHLTGSGEINETMEERARQRPNQGRPMALPRRVEVAIARRWIPMLEDLAERFADAPTNYPARWLERSRSAAAAP